MAMAVSTATLYGLTLHAVLPVTGSTPVLYVVSGMLYMRAKH